MKRSIAFVALLMAALMIFAGCSSYTKMGPAEYDKANLESAQYGSVGASFDTANWNYTDVGGFTVMYSSDAPDYNEDLVPTVTIGVGQNVPMMSTEMLDSLDATMEATTLTDGTEVIAKERVRIDGKAAYMIELRTILTEDMVNDLVEQGSLTEEMIEEAGGIDAYIGEGTQQMQIYIVIDNYLLLFTGSYDTKDQFREATINQMLTMIETASIGK